MRSVRLLTAAAAVAGSFTLSAPAQAQPCIPDVPGTLWFCLLTEYSSYRGFSGGTYGTVPGGPYVAGAGCYYPDGRPHYFVHAYTGQTGTITTYTIPVAAPACV